MSSLARCYAEMRDIDKAIMSERGMASLSHEKRPVMGRKRKISHPFHSKL